MNTSFYDLVANVPDGNGQTTITGGITVERLDPKVAPAGWVDHASVHLPSLDNTALSIDIDNDSNLGELKSKLEDHFNDHFNVNTTRVSIQSTEEKKIKRIK